MPTYQMRVIEGGQEVPQTPIPSARSVAAAIESGSDLDLLRAMELRMALAFDSPDTPARDLAAVGRRLLEIHDRIRDLAEAEKETARECEEASGDEEWSGV